MLDIDTRSVVAVYRLPLRLSFAFSTPAWVVKAHGNILPTCGDERIQRDQAGRTSRMKQEVTIKAERTI